MSDRILIVEDEYFIAIEMKSILESRGYEVAGIAADFKNAVAVAQEGVTVALVDLHLRDGFTGPEIGARLVADYGVTVLFVTANPALLGEGIAGTVGVISKPADPDSLIDALEFALARRQGVSKEPPRGMTRFA